MQAEEAAQLARPASAAARDWRPVAILLGTSALILGATQAPYVNWQPVAAPLDVKPLVIRKDAKGDGRFQSPRSGNRRHRGIDLSAPLQSPVRAIRSGRVVTVGMHHGLGTFIEVDHGRSLHSLYAHLQAATVQPGQRVRQGEQIGAVGKTGNARHRWISPHLHLEVLDHGTPINPQTLGLQIAESPAPDMTLEGADADGGE